MSFFLNRRMLGKILVQINQVNSMQFMAPRLCQMGKVLYFMQRLEDNTDCEGLCQIIPIAKASARLFRCIDSSFYRTKCIDELPKHPSSPSKISIFYFYYYIEMLIAQTTKREVARIDASMWGTPQPPIAQQRHRVPNLESSH